MFKTNIYRLIVLCVVIALSMFCRKEEEIGDPTPDNPIVADIDNGEVRIAAKLNRAWCDTASFHNCCVYKNGLKADQAVFHAHCKPEDFYDALIDVGADPGTDLGDDPDTSAVVNGSRLEFTIRWDGSPTAYTLSEIIEDSLGRGFEVRMGNSRERAVQTNMGCIFCYTSCHIGITSNAKYTIGDKLNRISQFKANGNLLPADGTELILTFKLLEW